VPQHAATRRSVVEKARVATPVSRTGRIRTRDLGIGKATFHRQHCTGVVVPWPVASEPSSTDSDDVSAKDRLVPRRIGDANRRTGRARSDGCGGNAGACCGAACCDGDEKQGSAAVAVTPAFVPIRGGTLSSAAYAARERVVVEALRKFVAEGMIERVGLTRAGDRVFRGTRETASTQTRA